MIEFELGPEPGQDKLPVEVTIAGDDYFLARHGEQYQLLSRICPHVGGTVMKHKDFYYCPLHMWRFDRRSGECTDVPGCNLHKVKVELRNGTLIAVFE